ncbi:MULTISPECIES: hypothetical protein [unclassified Rhodococcus (in: high G+C Gram-positive bacteria)]|uniref:hypothetical protein n=1 Tax=unclassified Rhodococcus (in: high G+C Gram-positive bacteria) TaxID=192944 RepID=UPI0012F6EED2|nr:hypothetical protein [Rhodococcus sp. DK17]
MPSTYRAGDLMLTILETDPPVAFCLDVATVDGGRGKDIRVDDSKTVLFDHGLSVERIKKKLGFTPQSRGFYEGEKARKILQALRDEGAEQKPWFAV